MAAITHPTICFGVLVLLSVCWADSDLDPVTAKRRSTLRSLHRQRRNDFGFGDLDEMFGDLGDLVDFGEFDEVFKDGRPFGESDGKVHIVFKLASRLTKISREGFS